MTITELRKEMMLSKKTNKERSLILSLILDKTQKIAKEDKNREAVDSDIETAAKAMMKQAEQSKALGMDVDFEISILKEFLPQVLSYEETELAVKGLIAHGVNDLKAIMNSLKNSQFTAQVDMKIASEIARKLLQK